MKHQDIKSPGGSVGSVELSDSSRRFLLGLGEASPKNFAKNLIHETLPLLLSKTSEFLNHNTKYEMYFQFKNSHIKHNVLSV